MDSNAYAAVQHISMKSSADHWAFKVFSRIVSWKRERMHPMPKFAKYIRQQEEQLARRKAERTKLQERDASRFRQIWLSLLIFFQQREIQGAQKKIKTILERERYQGREEINDWIMLAVTSRG